MEEVSVLVVEDGSAWQMALTQLISLCGYTCTAVGSAEEAIQLLETRSFRLILIDLSLPGHREGDKFLAWIACNGFNTRAIVYSGISRVALAKLASQYGLAGFWAKGTDTLNGLEVLIHQVLGTTYSST